MAGAKLSRRKIAAYIADELLAGHDAVPQLAAYLVETKRIREAMLIVRDIESALADRGVLIADIESARELTGDTADSISSYLKTTGSVKDVKLRATVDQTLLGGVRITTPDKRLDSTLRHRLNQLTATKI